MVQEGSPAVQGFSDLHYDHANVSLRRYGTETHDCFANYRGAEFVPHGCLRPRQLKSAIAGYLPPLIVENSIEELIAAVVAK